MKRNAILIVCLLAIISLTACTPTAVEEIHDGDEGRRSFPPGTAKIAVSSNIGYSFSR